jgi:heme-degrading monooxygenase HmoA
MAMHTSVRKYQIDPEQLDELNRRIEESFAPRVEQMPGFLAYEVIDCGGGRLYTVTTCNDREAAERSVELAAEFVEQELEGIEIERVEAAIGEVTVSRGVS